MENVGAGGLENIEISSIVFGNNARKFEDGNSQRQESFRELVESIRVNAVLQPILVRPVDGGKYEIIAGERRTRAVMHLAKEAGNETFRGVTIPAVIREGVSDQQAQEFMLTENMQREDLTAFEEAEAFKSYLGRYGDTPESLSELSARMGVPEHEIRMRVSLLSLPEAVLDAWKSGVISIGHLYELTRLDDEAEILSFLNIILSGDLSIRRLAEAIRNRAVLLKDAKFDRVQCATCISNTGIQGRLFDADTEGRCNNASCFQVKQTAFFESNWTESPAKAKYATNRPVFSHVVTEKDRIEVKAETVHERCVACPDFVTVVTLQGKVKTPKACVGKKDCYIGLYEPKKTEKAEKKSKSATKDNSKDQTAQENDAVVEKKANASSDKNTKTESTSEKPKTNNDKRLKEIGDKHREEFFRQTVDVRLNECKPGAEQSARTMLVALALSHEKAREIFLESRDKKNAGFGREISIAEAFSMTAAEVLPILHRMAVGVILQTSSSFSSGSSRAYLDLFAQEIGIDLKSEYTLDDKLLGDLTKDEIISEGEKLALFKDEKVMEKKNRMFPKKNLMSLKKSELVDLIVKSGADLKGKTPEFLSSGMAVKREY